MNNTKDKNMDSVPCKDKLLTFMHQLLFNIAIFFSQGQQTDINQRSRSHFSMLSMHSECTSIL